MVDAVLLQDARVAIDDAVFVCIPRSASIPEQQVRGESRETAMVAAAKKPSYRIEGIESLT